MDEAIKLLRETAAALLALVTATGDSEHPAYRVLDKVEVFLNHQTEGDSK